jgi:hypothetical protein
MHWLLIGPAVLVCWFALGWIAMALVVCLHRRDLLPSFGPNTDRLLARIIVAEQQLDDILTSDQNTQPERR